MGYDLQTVFHITFLIDIQAKSLPIYCILQMAIQKNLEEENIARLELCNIPLNKKKLATQRTR